jgi:hypothetical protein
MDETAPVVEVAQEFFRALARADWRGAVALMCPRIVEDAAEGWRSQMRMPSSRDVAVDRYRAFDPEMPEVVATYWAKQDERAERERANWWRHEFPGIASEEEVLQAPAEELMVRYVSTFGRMNMGEDWVIEWQVLGAVLDGSEEAFVVYRRQGARHRDEDGKVREFLAPAELLRMRRSEGRWCVADPHVIQRSGGAWTTVPDE